MSSDAMTCTFRHHMRQPAHGSDSWESTNLNLSEERQRHKHDRDGSESPRYDGKQRAHGEKCRRLDEHGDDGGVQSTDSGLRTGTSLPAEQDDSDDDHESEENVERKCARKEYETERVSLVYHLPRGYR